jgi:hypothetical protein
MNAGKKLVALLAVLVLAAGLAGSAWAAGNGLGVNPDPEDLLWFTDTTFTTGFSDGFGTFYGYNTVEDIQISDPGFYYLLVLHPQYYHTPNNEDWDEQAGATGVFTISSIYVWDGSDFYGNFVNGGEARIPVSYTQAIGNQAYLLCNVSGNFLNLVTGVMTPVTMYSAYLKIPDGVL